MFTQTFAGVRRPDAAGFLLAQLLALGEFVGVLHCNMRVSTLGD